MDINTVIQLAFLPFSLLIFLYFCTIFHRRNTSLLMNWPLLGMTPGLLRNAHRIHDFATSLLQENNQTFHFTGFANFNFVCTCDPANVNYVLSKNFTSYPKGPEFDMIFDILGDGIFRSEGHLWEVHRKLTMSLFNHARFFHMLQKTMRKKIEEGLIPLLDHVSTHEMEVDLQDILKRLAFDNICYLLLDHDPESLSLDLPFIPCQKATTDVEEAFLHRHMLPVSLYWKLQSWIGIGKEKSLSKAWEAIDDFIYTCISTKRKQVVLKNSELMSAAEEDEKTDFSTYMKLAEKENPENPDKFLRDTLLSLFVAGSDTTSTALTWFFWLLWKNPLVESKILEEIKRNLHSKEAKSYMLFNKKEELQRLVYLHGALCEALRLFPPVAFNHKLSIKSDILPSGHRVDKDWKVVLSFYAMARMENVWGKDCLEFKPERWITETGGIKHQPSYKFTAFGAGPRSCLGKDMAFTQMKIVAATIIHDYKIQVVEGHPIVPKDSVVMEMKYGLKIRLAKRSDNLVPAASKNSTTIRSCSKAQVVHNNDKL